MVDKEAKGMYHRWDRIWKFFCDPRSVIGEYFIPKLVSAEASHYDIEFSSSATLELASTKPQEVQPLIDADCVILVNEDSRSQKLHFEFESAPDSEMVLRTLQYALGQREKTKAKLSHHALYRLPISYIVDVKGFASENVSTMSASFLYGNREFTVTYPVVHALKVFPKVRDIMEAETFEDVTREVQDFANSIPNLDETSGVYRAFIENRCALADPAVFTLQGVDEGSVTFMADQIIRTGETIPQRAKREALEEGARNIAKTFHISFEEAWQAMTSGSENLRGIRPLNLDN